LIEGFKQNYEEIKKDIISDEELHLARKISAQKYETKKWNFKR
jgi:lipoate-protein ligase A